MADGLTTHILDLARGRPAAGVAVSLHSAADGRLIAETATNQDGRSQEVLLAADAFETGIYELRFKIGDYFAAHGVSSFYDVIPIRFRITRGERSYHVPLLVSPFGYSTYRGS